MMINYPTYSVDYKNKHVYLPGQIFFEKLMVVDGWGKNILY